MEITLEEILTEFSKSSERHKTSELEITTNPRNISRKTHPEAL